MNPAQLKDAFEPFWRGQGCKEGMKLIGIDANGFYHERTVERLTSALIVLNDKSHWFRDTGQRKAGNISVITTRWYRHTPELWGACAVENTRRNIATFMSGFDWLSLSYLGITDVYARLQQVLASPDLMARPALGRTKV